MFSLQTTFSTSRRYNCELNNRKKLEVALADSHRLLTEKDLLIQELRITIAQHQNHNLDLRKEFDENRDQLNTLLIKYDKAAALSSNLEADVQKLSSQISFERELQKTVKRVFSKFLRVLSSVVICN